MALIIAGHPRSGTGLLQTLCTWHPEMVVTCEFGNYSFLEDSYFVHARNVISRWQRIRGKWAFDSAYAKDKENLNRNNRNFTLRYLYYLGVRLKWRIDAVNIEAAYRQLFPQVKIVGDKWPDYLFQLGKLRKIPNVKLIVIYRDCRDVTSSFLKKTRGDWSDSDWVKNVNSAEKIASRWVKGIEIMETHSDQILMLQYESLMEQPDHEMDRIGDYLGIDPQGFPADIISPSSIGKHQKGLSNEELNMVMKVAGSTMERLGYLV